MRLGLPSAGDEDVRRRDLAPKALEGPTDAYKAAKVSRHAAFVQKSLTSVHGRRQQEEDCGGGTDPPSRRDAQPLVPGRSCVERDPNEQQKAARAAVCSFRSSSGLRGFGLW